MKADEIELLTHRLLEEGVPPGVVSRALDIDPDLVRAAQSEVRVERYGTDDLTEYTEQAQWDAIDEARRIIAHGSASEKARILSTVLSKHVALSARRTPQAQRNATDAVLEALTNMREGTAGPAELSPFVVRVDDA